MGSDTAAAAAAAAAPQVPIAHIARQYQNFPGAPYVLPADEDERKRLLFQHELLRTVLDNKIFFPPHKSEEAYFILDSGVGCGAWMLDVASQLSPSTIIHGIDIESRLFPANHQHNLSFSVNSITSLPAAWTNRFDYVHQRLLIAALRRSDWRAALQEMTRVLVPGGWVELLEFGTIFGGKHTERHMSMLQALFKTRDMVLDISNEIPSLLQEAKFVNCTIEKRMIPLGEWAGQVGKDARDNFITMFRGMKTPVLNAGGLGFVNSEEEYDEHITSLEKDWNETVGAELEAFVFCAQVEK